MNRFCSTVVAAACATLVGISSAHGQESLQQVKALYASAAYEDALSMVGRLQATGRKPEFEQYRVYCLVALGRTAEAEKAIASVVVENPTFLPDAEETSPRIQEMFLRIRRGLVPEIAQRMYLDARAAWNRKDTSAASDAVRVADSVDRHRSAAGADANSASDSAEPMLSELRLLATGFLDLGRALSAPPARAVDPVPSRPARARGQRRSTNHVRRARKAGPSACGCRPIRPPAVSFEAPFGSSSRRRGCHAGGTLAGCPPCLRSPAASGGQDLDLPASYEGWGPDRV